MTLKLLTNRNKIGGDLGTRSLWVTTGVTRSIAVKSKQSETLQSLTQTLRVDVTGLLDGCIINSVVVKSSFINDHSDENTILQMFFQAVHLLSAR